MLGTEYGQTSAYLHCIYSPFCLFLHILILTPINLYRRYPLKRNFTACCPHKAFYRTREGRICFHICLRFFQIRLSEIRRTKTHKYCFIHRTIRYYSVLIASFPLRVSLGENTTHAEYPSNKNVSHKNPFHCTILLIFFSYNIMQKSAIPAVPSATTTLTHPANLAS